MKGKRVLFGICGSFCNHEAVLAQIETLCKDNDVQPVVSENVYQYSTRYFERDVFISRLETMCGHPVMHTIVDAEKVGPANIYDIMVIAPMTGTVAAKMANGIYDHPVTLAAKAMIRNQKNIVFGIATNDGLGISGRNIFTLMAFRYFYAVPFRQDAPFEKGRSIVAKWDLIERTCESALDDQQLQPILLGGEG